MNIRDILGSLIVADRRQCHKGYINYLCISRQLWHCKVWHDISDTHDAAAPAAIKVLTSFDATGTSPHQTHHVRILSSTLGETPAQCSFSTPGKADAEATSIRPELN